MIVCGLRQCSDRKRLLAITGTFVNEQRVKHVRDARKFVVGAVGAVSHKGESTVGESVISVTYEFSRGPHEVSWGPFFGL